MFDELYLSRLKIYPRNCNHLVAMYKKKKRLELKHFSRRLEVTRALWFCPGPLLSRHVRLYVHECICRQEGLFGQTVVFKRSSVPSLQSRVPLVLFPRHPPHTGKYRVTLLPLCSLCATRQSSALWFAAKKTAASGLVCCPSCRSQPPLIGSRARCLFSLTLLGKKDGGGGDGGAPWYYLWVWLLECMWREHLLLHTVNWQAVH